MNYREIIAAVTDGVLQITLNRPDKLNAYTPDMGDELVHALRAAEADAEIHAAIITGAGKAFCAGADLEFLGGELSRSGKALGQEEFIASFTEEFAELELLTIAAINGAAAGIGITGMLAADIRVVAEDAKLVLNFAELGIVPGLGSSYFLPRLVGAANARELLLCERRLSGARAAELGLANHAVAVAEVLPLAQQLATAAADCKPGMIGTIKQALNTGQGATLAQALVNEAALSVRKKS
ncbi:enoyl-CoA hydratase/isomerase family protein [Candidatus Litorirhabdus singularis]|uniref:enoyl-CoA hydratase/isomerase family protein n=1 Tax=Candidatus Litorirhabdus singularis TaxID=2518993 RepID=UPI00242AD951|nr:enoyl-CoA hydratase/isomerase family protein [Candidatus Litorirhabdus singularis]